MGCFNYSCGLSNASIGYSDRAGVILLTKNQYSLLKRDCSLISDMYIPVSGPIFGKYNDYGSLMDIERSPMVEAMEHEYKTPIEGIFASLLSDSPYDTEMRKFFFQDTPLPYDENERFKAFDRSDLVGWGFTPKTESKWAYGQKTLTIEGSNKFHVTDGDTSPHNFVARTAVEFLDNFHSATQIWLGLSRVESDRFNRLITLTAMYYLPEVYDALLPVVSDRFLSMSKYFEVLLEDIKRVSGTEDSSAFAVSDLNMGNSFVREVVSVKSMDVFKHMAMNQDAWRPLWHMYDMMQATNQAYMPPVMGSQTGSPHAEKAVAEVIQARAEEQIAEFEN